MPSLETLPVDYDSVPPEVRAAWDVAAHWDSNDIYRRCRDLDTYLECLGGLGMFLEHARNIDGSSLIVDVGAGEAIAVNELAVLPVYSDGLSFAATGITSPHDSDPYCENELPYVVAGAETLRGVERTAGLLAVTSITYSPRPDMVVAAYGRTLVPGGVAKAACPREYDHDVYTSGAQTYEGLFKDAGFDAFYHQLEVGSHVVVAVSPGGNPLYGAQEVLARDMSTIADMRCALNAMLDAV
jgi:hypothetical protein